MMVRCLGKSYRDSFVEIDTTTALLAEMAEVGREYAGEERAAGGLVRKQPLGVCLMFPYYSNPLYSSLIVAWPALLMGNVVLLKPSAYSAWIGEYLRDRMREAAGRDILAACYLDAQVLPLVLECREVRQITYMGSRPAGKLIVERVAESRFINTTLFYSSKATGYVDPSADLEKAAEHVAFEAFRNNGQDFECLSILFLSNRVADQFIDLLRPKVEAIAAGDPAD